MGMPNWVPIVGLGLSAVMVWVALEDRKAKKEESEAGIIVRLPPGAELWSQEAIDEWFKQNRSD